MISRSKIRQVCINYLYSSILAGEGGLDNELFWEISLEKPVDQHRRQLAKLLLHLTRASEDSLQILNTRADVAIEHMVGDMSSTPMRDAIKRYVRQNEKFEDVMPALRHSMEERMRDKVDEVELYSSSLMHEASVTIMLGDELLRYVSDYPSYLNKLEPLTAVVKRRRRLMESIVACRRSECLPASGETCGLARAAQELVELRTQLRPSVQEVADKILSQLYAYDAIIEPLLHNYTLDRIDLIDKCIIYQGLYELRESQLDLALVVSEASALAHRYAGPKSAPFIHGILSASTKPVVIIPQVEESTTGAEYSSDDESGTGDEYGSADEYGSDDEYDSADEYGSDEEFPEIGPIDDDGDTPILSEAELASFRDSEGGADIDPFSIQQY